MFFRPAQAKDFSTEAMQDLILEQCFVLENHLGVLGIASLQQNTITIIKIQEEHYITFLEMIEEYLFMKFSSIILLNPLASINLIEQEWTVDNNSYNNNCYIKEKKSFIDRQYTMTVPQTSE